MNETEKMIIEGFKDALITRGIKYISEQARKSGEEKAVMNINCYGELVQLVADSKTGKIEYISYEEGDGSKRIYNHQIEFLDYVI